MNIAILVVALIGVPIAIVALLVLALKHQNHRFVTFMTNGAEPCLLSEEYVEATERSRWIMSARLADQGRVYDEGWMWSNDEESFTGCVVGIGVRGSLAIRLQCQGVRSVGTVIVAGKRELVHSLLSKRTGVSHHYVNGWMKISIIEPGEGVECKLNYVDVKNAVENMINENPKINVLAVELRTDGAWFVVTTRSSHLIDAEYLSTVRNYLEVMI